MMGGRAAADTILDMRKTGDFSKASCKQYERRWIRAYGHDFYMSVKMAEMIYRWVRTLGSYLNKYPNSGPKLRWRR